MAHQTPASLRQYGVAVRTFLAHDRDPRSRLPTGDDRHRPGRLPRQRERLTGPAGTTRAVGSDLIGQGVHPPGRGEREAEGRRRRQPGHRGGPAVLPEPALGRRHGVRPAIDLRVEPRPREQGPHRRDQGTPCHRCAARRRRPRATSLPTRCWPAAPDSTPTSARPTPREQVARVARERGLSQARGPCPGRRAHPRTHTRIPGGAAGQRPRPQPRPGRGSAGLRGHVDEQLDPGSGGGGMKRGRAPDLPRRRPRGREDLRHARRGPPPGRARHRRRRRVRRDPRPQAHRSDARGPRGRRPARARPTATPTSPRWTSTQCSRADPRWPWSTSSPTPTSRAPATRSAGRTSRSSSPPGSTSSPPSTSSTWSRSTTSWRRSPESRNANASPTPWSAPPTRSTSSTWHPRPCDAGWRTATSTPRPRSTPPWATTSGSGTSPPCASWHCCGSRTRSTTRCRPTASSTASRAPGRPGNGSSSRSPAAPRARP